LSPCCQVASRPNEVNCNVHETLALTMDQDTKTNLLALLHRPIVLQDSTLVVNVKSIALKIYKM